MGSRRSRSATCVWKVMNMSEVYASRFSFLMSHLR